MSLALLVQWLSSRSCWGGPVRNFRFDLFVFITSYALRFIRRIFGSVGFLASFFPLTYILVSFSFFSPLTDFAFCFALKFPLSVYCTFVFVSFLEALILAYVQQRFVCCLGVCVCALLSMFLLLFLLHHLLQIYAIALLSLFVLSCKFLIKLPQSTNCWPPVTSFTTGSTVRTQLHHSVCHNLLTFAAYALVVLLFYQNSFYFRLQ